MSAPHDAMQSAMRERLVAAARAFAAPEYSLETLLAEAQPFVEAARRAATEADRARELSWREARSFVWLLAYRLGDQGWPAPLAACVVPAWRDAADDEFARASADELQALALEGYARGREDRVQSAAQLALAAAMPVLEFAPRMLLIVAAGRLDVDGARALADRASAALLRRDATVAVLELSGLEAPTAAVLVELWAVLSAARMLGVLMVVAGVRGALAESVSAAGVCAEGETRVETLPDALAHVARSQRARPDTRLLAWLRGLLSTPRAAR